MAGEPAGDDLLRRLSRWFRVDREEILTHFASLPGALRGGGDGTGFVWIPGKRSDRVVLTAHADSVWDDRPDFPAGITWSDGRGRSRVAGCGCGADDRAGLAMLWEFRRLGHSLLVTDGEERGSLGSREIMEREPALAGELNRTHMFMVGFDRRGGGDFKCYDVGTDAFRAYIARATGCAEPDRLRTTDIRVLCREICGVNLSVGYHDEHTPAESLDYGEWRAMLERCRKWLAGGPLPRFPLRVAG